MTPSPGTDPAVVKHVYNNNVVLAVEGGREVVLLGKGLGFQRRAGDAVKASLVRQRFVADGRPERVADVLADAPLEEVTVAFEIAQLGRATLGVEPRQSLIVPLLDHLTYAVRRARAGQVMDFPLRWEVDQLYPVEARLGRRAVALVAERLGVTLQDEEWVAFALHFVNQQWASADISRTVLMTETIGRAFDLLAAEWGVRIDESTPGAERFVTHLRYLFVRVATDQAPLASPLDLAASLRVEHPRAADGADRVAALVGAAVRRELSRDEVSYLSLHVGRLYLAVAT
ncbi:PRD domain-containing protein [Micrococcales bacterium 31B]|nr:PRD domain-containing protein [Micrococcales bacterium 31B]